MTSAILFYKSSPCVWCSEKFVWPTGPGVIGLTSLAVFWFLNKAVLYRPLTVLHGRFSDSHPELEIPLLWKFWSLLFVSCVNEAVNQRTDQKGLFTFSPLRIII